MKQILRKNISRKKRAVKRNEKKKAMKLQEKKTATSR
jgi:hypothetical protein